ncbi:MAG: hypothetical protein V7K71_03800 [Nostoc sp.]
MASYINGAVQAAQHNYEYNLRLALNWISIATLNNGNVHLN